jgi:hypothetical protein
MFGFFNKIFSNFLSSSKNEPEEPDDGGLAEFAKQLAQELDEEAKHGKKRAHVSADSVLKVQQGRSGGKAYLLDTSDFRNAIAKELRDSVAPVTEGILKSRCGEKGAGYMNVQYLYIFNIRRDDPVDEYNAAMDIIDSIGVRLLGERYSTGERMKVPVATVVPDELFMIDGTFDFKKAEKTVQWVRDSGAHGPADVNWETGEVSVAAGAPNWQPNKVTPIAIQNKQWQEQQHQSITKSKGNWERLEHKSEQTPKGDWQEIKTAAQKKEEKSWTAIEVPKPKEKEEPVWSEIKKPEPEATEPVNKNEIKKPEPELKEPDVFVATQPVPIRTEEIKEVQIVKPTDLKQLGTVMLAFRPSWRAREQTIDTYAGCTYRKTSNIMLSGEQVYPEDNDPDIILKIDQAVAEQAIIHLTQTQHIDKKVIVLPFHFTSLSAQNSPLKDLFELHEQARKSVWIEIVGLGSNASPSRIGALISNLQDRFGAIGLRFDLGQISRALIERSKANFLSCDVEASTLHGLQMRGIESDLPDLLNMAKAFKMDICTWGLRNRQDLMFAIQEGSTLINGAALAKEMKKPGKIIPVSASKLIGR